MSVVAEIRQGLTIGEVRSGIAERSMTATAIAEAHYARIAGGVMALIPVQAAMAESTAFWR